MSPSTLLALHDHYCLYGKTGEPFNLIRGNSRGLVNPAKHPSLGKGGFGEVHAISGPFSGSPWAVKSVPETGIPTTHSIALLNEKDALIKLAGAPHTIELKGFLQSKNKTELAMRRLQGPDLANLIAATPERFTYKILQSIAKQAMKAFEYYEKKRIVHADIKVENCFYNFETDELTIIDLGNAFCPDTATKPSAFTLSSMAPEQVAKRRSSYGIDMWALGIMLFKIYTGHGLFFDSSFDLDKQKLNKKDLLALMGEQFPHECPAFLRILTLETRHRCPRVKIHQAFPAYDLKQQGMKYIPPFEKNIHPWYRTSWQQRIQEAADSKNESKYAPEIIDLLEKMFVFDDQRRLTPEDGLHLFAKAHQKNPIFRSSKKEPRAPKIGVHSNSQKSNPMQELELEETFVNLLDAKMEPQAYQGRVLFSSSIDQRALEIRSNSPILELLQEINGANDPSAQFLELEITSAEV